MSMTYWMIEGVGIKTDAIWNRLDDKKVVQFLAQEFPDEVTSMEAEAALAAIARGESCPINIRDYLHGEPLDSLGEAIALCDDTEILTYGDDGEKLSTSTTRRVCLGEDVRSILPALVRCIGESSRLFRSSPI